MGRRLNPQALACTRCYGRVSEIVSEKLYIYIYIYSVDPLRRGFSRNAIYILRRPLRRPPGKYAKRYTYIYIYIYIYSVDPLRRGEPI